MIFYIKNLGDFCFLLGDKPPESKNNKWYLAEGEYRMELIGGHRSNQVKFNKYQIEVSISKSNLVVIEYTGNKHEFLFDTRVSFGNYDKNSSISFNSVVFRQLKAQDPQVYFRLVQVRFSHNEERINGYGNMQFPSNPQSNKMGITSIRGIYRTGQGNDQKRFFVDRIDEKIVVNLGRSSLSDFSSNQSSTIFLPKDTNWFFEIGSFRDGNFNIDSTLFSKKTKNLGVLTFSENHHWGLGPVNNLSNQVEFNNLEVSNGWLSLYGFTTGEKMLTNTNSAKDGFSESLFGDSDMFTFHTTSSFGASVDDQESWDHFEFKNNLDVSKGYRHKYYGLQINAIRDKANMPLTMLGNKVFLLMSPKPKDSRPIIMGGSLMVVRNQEINSILSPNHYRYFADNEGYRAHIPLSSATLCIEGLANQGSDFEINTKSKTFKINFPSLLASAFGESMSKRDGQKNDKNLELSKLNFSLIEGVDSISFEICENYLKPQKGDDWLLDFEVKDSPVFDLIEEGDMNIQFNPPEVEGNTKLKTGLFEDDEKSYEQTKFNEITLAIGLEKPSIKPKSADKKRKEIDKTKILLKDLIDEKFKFKGLDDFVLSFLAKNGVDERLEGFIRSNLSQGAPTPDLFMWEFKEKILGAILAKKDDEGKLVFANELAYSRFEKNTGLLINYSEHRKVWNKNIGIVDYDSYVSWVKQSPELWPWSRKNVLSSGGDYDKNIGFDPGASKWKGFFLMNFPIGVVIPDDIRDVNDKFPVLKKLLEQLESELFLKYGWVDAKGNTWNVGLYREDENQVINLMDQSWIKVDLIDIKHVGIHNKNEGFWGYCQFTIPWFPVREEVDDTPAPLKIDAGFKINIDEQGKLIREFTITSNFPDTGLYIGTIPGFEKVKLVKPTYSDLKVLSLKLNLFPSKELTEALPVFTTNVPLEAELFVNLANDDSPKHKFSLTLNSYLETKLFGLWPIVITGASLNINDDITVLAFNAHIKVPIGDSTKVGVTVFLSKAKKESSWSFDVRITDLDFKLDLGDALKGRFILAWTDEAFELNDVPGDTTIQSTEMYKGKNKKFFGGLIVEKSKIFGDFELYFKLGNYEDQSYWIALYKSNDKKDFLVGKIDKPFFLIGHDADRYDGSHDPSKPGMLEDNVTDPSVDIVGELRNTKNPMKYLDSWKYNPRIGTLVALSGFWEMNPQLSKKPKEENSNLTSLIFTTNGILRIDAVTNLFGLDNVRIAFAINTVQKRIMAGFQLPDIKISPTENPPSYIINTGFMGVEFSYGKSKKLLMSLGWPTKKGKTEFHRDWTRSVRVTWDKAYPINTFMGGLLFDYDEGAEYIKIGVAVRGGYVKSFNFKAGPFKGEASLSVLVGGLIIYKYNFGDKSFGPIFKEPVFDSLSLSHADLFPLSEVINIGNEEEMLIAKALSSINNSLSELEVKSLCIQGELFGDIDGSAKATLFGYVLASIAVNAFARFKLVGNTDDGVTCAKGIARVSASIKIGCVTKKGSASIKVSLIDKKCSC